MMDRAKLLASALAYAESRGITLRTEAKLGHGSDGDVWESSRYSAVKAIERLQTYDHEVECYRRLRDAGVRHLGGFDIPELEDHDDRLRIVEISIVQPPFLLDFGKVYLDREPPYWDDPQMRADAYEEWRDRFEHRWPGVAAVLEMLKKYGIHYVDPRPGNIEFGEE